MSGSASAPASSANLGPGFDCIGLALELRCRVTAEPSDRWEYTQDGVTTYPGDGDLVARSIAAVAETPMRLHIENEIPRSRGLGSSSAVTTAAAAAALRAIGIEPDPNRIFEIVAGLEGHCDNAAAAAFGGLVLTKDGEWGHLELWPGFVLLVAIPDHELSTSDARAVLSANVPRPVAARNLARFGFLVEGLRTGDRRALRLAGGDELHEMPRAQLSPITGELISAACDAGALHAAWSGAGPACIAFTTEADHAGVLEALDKTLDGAGNVQRLEMATAGLE